MLRGRKPIVPEAEVLAYVLVRLREVYRAVPLRPRRKHECIVRHCLAVAQYHYAALPRGNLTNFYDRADFDRAVIVVEERVEWHERTVLDLVLPANGHARARDEEDEVWARIDERECVMGSVQLPGELACQ